MNFLIVDDEPDILDLLNFMIETNIDCNIQMAGNGDAAIEKIRESKFDVVFCDYNMPKKNGGQVFTYIQEKKIESKFVLISSDPPSTFPEFQDKEPSGFLTKPFVEKDLVTILESLSLNSTTGAKDTEYVKIKISLIEKIHELKHEIYVKLSDEKHIKVLNQFELITDEIIDKYIKKEFEYLYIKKSDSESFINSYLHDIEMYNKSEIKDYKKHFSNHVNALRSLSQALGWNDSVKELALKNIDAVVSDIKSKPPLKEYLKQIKNDEGDYFMSHTSLLSYICTGFLKNFGEKDPKVYQELVMASIIHDISLSDEALNNKFDYVLAIKEDRYNNLDVVKEIKNHSSKIEQVVNDNFGNHELVKQIVLDHHELPNGKGFPHGKKPEEIGIYSSLFIIAEHLADFIYQTNHCDTDLFIKEYEGYFNSANYQKVFQKIFK